MWSDAVPVGHPMPHAPKKAKMSAMRTGKTIAGAEALVLCALALGCGSSGKQLAGTGGQGGGQGGQGGGGNSPTTSETLTIDQKGNQGRHLVRATATRPFAGRCRLGRQAAWASRCKQSKLPARRAPRSP
jgi:hypothetical protein